MSMIYDNNGLISMTSYRSQQDLKSKLNVALHAKLIYLDQQDKLYQGEPTSSTIKALTMIGYLLCELGRPSEALQYHERARMMIYERYHTDCVEDVAHTQAMLANLLDELGDNYSSIQYYTLAQNLKRFIQVYESKGGGGTAIGR